MANTDKTQLVVIGAGPGGYAAAFHAAALGLQVTLVNAEPKLGGVCLRRGCIPSKALLHVARLIHEAREGAEWGVSFEQPGIDLDRLRGWKNQVVEKLSGGISQLAGARKVKVLHARARFADGQTLSLEYAENASGPERLEFDNCILASGSRPAIPKPFQIDDPRIMDSTGALDLQDIPESLLVIGGGYIGLEMGTVYHALGSKVTVVEMLDGLLPGADRDLVKPLQQRLEKQFAAIHLNTKVESLQPTPQGIVAILGGAGTGEFTFSRALISVGRRPNHEDLGLENTKIEVTERGFVKVDRRMRTAEERIFAIGDIAGEPMLAHKASREGKVAAEAIAGRRTVFDNVAIPAVVFTDPEIAWCGLTENEATARGQKIEVARFPWGASGRAMSVGRPDGLTKLIFDPETERVLGVGIVGVNAGELIAEGVLAVEMAAVAHDVADTIHAHPTLSETVGEGAELYFGQATHLYRQRK